MLGSAEAIVAILAGVAELRCSGADRGDITRLGDLGEARRFDAEGLAALTEGRHVLPDLGLGPGLTPGFGAAAGGKPGQELARISVDRRRVPLNDRDVG